MRERERIARDLHDTFFQAIQGLLLRFNTGTDQLKPDEPARALLEETLKQSDRVMLEGRELVLDIRGEAQEGGDLSKAFAEVAAALRKTRETDFQLICHGSLQAFHPIVGEELHRIGKEALTNAFLHSRAKVIVTDAESSPLPWSAVWIPMGSAT